MKRKHALTDRARSQEVLSIGTGMEGGRAEVLGCDYHNYMEVDGADNNLTGQGCDTVVAASSSVKREKALCGEGETEWLGMS